MDHQLWLGVERDPQRMGDTTGWTSSVYWGGFWRRGKHELGSSSRNVCYTETLYNLNIKGRHLWALNLEETWKIPDPKGFPIGYQWTNEQFYLPFNTQYSIKQKQKTVMINIHLLKCNILLFLLQYSKHAQWCQHFLKQTTITLSFQYPMKYWNMTHESSALLTTQNTRSQKIPGWEPLN